MPMTSSTNSLRSMYRSPYGVGYNEPPMHLSYEMDLSRDHKNHSKSGGCVPNGCWSALVKLFVWTVIVFSLVGVVISIAFIIYIEKFAADTCCDDRPILNITGSYDHINDNRTDTYSTTTAKPPSVPIVFTSERSDFKTSFTTSSPKLVSKMSSNVTSFPVYESNTESYSSESVVTNSSDSNPETGTHESNVTEVLPKTTTTTPQMTTISPSIKPIEGTTEKMTNSSSESRVLYTNESQTPEPELSKEKDGNNVETNNKTINVTTPEPQKTTPESDIIAEVLKTRTNATETTGAPTASNLPHKDSAQKESSSSAPVVNGEERQTATIQSTGERVEEQKEN